MGRRCLWVLGALLMVATANPEAARTMPVVLADLAAPGHLSIDVMSSEVAAILAPLGVRLSWHAVTPGEGEASDRLSLLVVLLGRSFPGGRPGEPVLASARPRPDGGTVWISVPNLLLAAKLPGNLEVLDVHDQTRLGLALARVIVHEMVHLADPGLPHGTRGLFASSLGRRELVDSVPHLERAARESLLRALSRWSAGRGEDGLLAAASLR
jgi:hypothetical protein